MPPGSRHWRWIARTGRFLLLGAAAGLWSSGSDAAEMSTAVTGQWSDACPCRMPCPCWRSARANVDRCTNVHVISLDGGTYRGAGMQGAVFVLVAESAEIGSAPTPRKLYVEKRETSARVRSIEALARRLYGDGWSTEAVDMSAQFRWKEQEVEIPDVLLFRVVSPEPPLRLERVVRDYLYPWLYDAEQWVAERVEYSSGDGGRERFSGTNAVRARVRILP